MGIPNQRGGGGLTPLSNFSYNSSPHLNFFPANGPLRLCAPLATQPVSVGPSTLYLAG